VIVWQAWGSQRARVSAASLTEFLSRAQFDSPAFRAGMRFLQHASKDRVDEPRVFDSVINLHGVVVHLRAAVRTYYFAD
jgi:hypothetical protein